MHVSLDINKLIGRLGIIGKVKMYNLTISFCFTINY